MKSSSIPLLGALALSACGATNPAPATVAHGTLDLARSLPAPTPTPLVAYGVRQTSSDTQDRSSAEASIAPYLRTTQAKIARPAAALAATPAVPVAPVAAASTRMREAPAPHEPQLAAHTQSANRATSLTGKTDTTRSDADRYAQRQSRELESYRGGDVIVITAGTVVIVLLVALLILLIT